MNKFIKTGLIILLLLSLVACGKVNMEEWQAQYALGVKYLKEGNYEEAVIAFTKAIEIDAKSAPSYMGRADAYFALAENAEDKAKAMEYYENAVKDYSKAASLGNDEANTKKDNIESLILALKESENAKDLLQPLYDSFSGSDYESVVSMMRAPEYKALSNMKSPYLIYSGDGTNYLLLYPDNHCYYGEFSGGARSGNGIWIESEPTEKTREKHVDWQIYNGTWNNNAPDGSGTITITLSSESQKGLFDIYPLKKEIKGTFKNGTYNGQINQIWYMDIGDVFVWDTIIADNGVYKRIEGENSSEGKYPVSRATKNGEGRPTLFSDGSVQYVFGFEK